MEFNIEHSNLVQQLPMLLMVVFTLLSVIAPVNEGIKIAILMGGMVSGFAGIGAMIVYANLKGLKPHVIKAVIDPTGEEVEFFVTPANGKTNSKQINEKYPIFRSYWQLEKPVWLENFGGKIEGIIQIDSYLEFSTRCKPTTSWVIYNAMEICHSNVYQVRLKVPKYDISTADMAGLIPRFYLTHGSQDDEIIEKLGHDPLRMVEKYV